MASGPSCIFHLYDGIDASNPRGHGRDKSRLPEVVPDAMLKWKLEPYFWRSYSTLVDANLNPPECIVYATTRWTQYGLELGAGGVFAMKIAPKHWDMPSHSLCYVLQMNVSLHCCQSVFGLCYRSSCTG